MRTKNFLKNLKSGFLLQLLTEILRFSVRTVFIHNFSSEYLGINGLFASILTMLSIAELGLGAAITYSLYAPLARDDKQTIKSIMAFYKKTYRLIGLSILVLSVAIMPVLSKLINGDTNLVNIYFVFILYIINAVSGYLFYAYKASILYADQKKYETDKCNAYAQMSMSLLQILALLGLRHTPELAFYLYNVSQIVATVMMNYLIARKVDKLYPYINERDILPLEKEVKDSLTKNIKALSIGKISQAALQSIDSIVISMSVIGGTALVGMYSNYLAIVAAVEVFIKIVSSALVSGLGNFNVTESKQRQKEVLDSLDLFYVWLYGFCGICFYVLMNPFIGGVWIDKDWLLSNTAVFLIAFVFIQKGATMSLQRFIESNGLYHEARYRYIISAILNIILSFTFVLKFNWGIEGVIFATVLCTFGMESISPYVVYKNVFSESSKKYYLKYFINLSVMSATAYLTKYIADIISPSYNIWGVLGRLGVCIIVINMIFLIVYANTKSFKYIKTRLISIAKKR